jgi:hypothetical protein
MTQTPSGVTISRQSLVRKDDRGPKIVDPEKPVKAA